MINIKKVDKLAEDVKLSGHNLCFEVLKILEEIGWNVEMSPYYCDNVTNLPREADIIAQKYFPFETENKQTHIKVTLFIECKYVNAPIAVWLYKKNFEKAKIKIMQETNTNEGDGYYNNHHYMNKNDVVKMYTKGDEKKTENEDLYKAINQCLNANKYFEENQSFFMKSLRYAKKLNFPVIITNSFDNFHKVDFRNKNKLLALEEKHLQLEVDYTFLNKQGQSSSEYFLIDMVSISELINYINETIKNDIDKLIDYSCWKIEKIANKR